MDLNSSHCGKIDIVHGKQRHLGIYALSPFGLAISTQINCIFHSVIALNFISAIAILWELCIRAKCCIALGAIHQVPITPYTTASSCSMSVCIEYAPPSAVFMQVLSGSMADSVKSQELIDSSESSRKFPAGNIHHENPSIVDPSKSTKHRAKSHELKWLGAFSLASIGTKVSIYHVLGLEESAGKLDGQGITLAHCRRRW